MTKEIRSPNVEDSQLCGRRFRHSDFVIPSDFVIRHSDFENCSLFNQKAGQRTGESGRRWVGSWKATFRFFACIGTMNLRIARYRLGLRQFSGVLAMVVSLPNVLIDWTWPNPVRIVSGS